MSNLLESGLTYILKVTGIFHYKYVVSRRSFEIVLNRSVGRLKGVFPPFP